MLRAYARSALIVIVRAAALAKLLADNVHGTMPKTWKSLLSFIFFAGLFVCRGCFSTSIAVDVPQPAASASRFAMDASSSHRSRLWLHYNCCNTSPDHWSSARLASLLSLLLLPLTVLLPSPKHLYMLSGGGEAFVVPWRECKKRKKNKCIMCPPSHQVIIMRKKPWR